MSMPTPVNMSETGGIKVRICARDEKRRLYCVETSINNMEDIVRKVTMLIQRGYRCSMNMSQNMVQIDVHIADLVKKLLEV